VKLINKETILEITKEWDGERFPDGRPRVPDDIIKRMVRPCVV
jgi:hypothetical protein